MSRIWRLEQAQLFPSLSLPELGNTSAPPDLSVSPQVARLAAILTTSAPSTLISDHCFRHLLFLAEARMEQRQSCDWTPWSVRILERARQLRSELKHCHIADLHMVVQSGYLRCHRTFGGTHCRFTATWAPTIFVVVIAATFGMHFVCTSARFHPYDIFLATWPLCKLLVCSRRLVSIQPISLVVC